uniref:CSON003096 protein n=1 Tax=Culicoides sonorensis TaxID=179676 RepID=A0A336MML0_CULSO
MTDESADRQRWEAAMARNQYQNYGVDLQSSHDMNNETMKENYTLLRDSYGNIVKVYGLNLEGHQNYELFNSSPNQNLSYLPNNSMNNQTSHSNYQQSHQQNFQQEYFSENWMPHHNENPFSGNTQQQEPQQKPLVQGHNMQSNYSSNPIINQLSNWTPGTSIYGDCFLPSNNLASDNLHCANETHHQMYEQTQNIANIQQPIMSSNIVSPQLKKKQRIIAEVKPMRMSYSEALSKNVLSENQNSNHPVNSGANNPSSVNTATQQVNNKKKSNQARSPIQFEKRSPITVQSDDKVRKASNNPINGEKGIKPTNEVIKPNPTISKETKDTKNTSSAAASESKPKKTLKKTQKNTKNKIKGNQQASKSVFANEFKQDDESYHLIPDDSIPETEGETYESIYNVNYDRISTKSSQSSSAHKKSKQSVNVSSSGGRISSKQDKFYSKRNHKNQKSHRYRVLLEKCWAMWLEYIIKFILWLWSLVSDVVYLSFGIIWDKIVVTYQHANQYISSLCSEVGSRPNIWIKSLWSKTKTNLEKINFWRKFFTKKPVEPLKDYYKDGKLPTTADEAMYSLLNCKGKDAYSILGVTKDCPQEQIRKHFHKIALLVHPDKNKQIGSEEAFKVLQRSFELIGEPESRKQYDLSLAEALNAEKAWSELNDLLKQLHTKISEAANTIRCSSCCSRHPRKPTVRPHYAARECNSCRIRHSAREGDIWAETAFFGLRWKYLALMEGKVYDITEWANCQKGALSHLQPNSHIVQYRIVLGQNSQQQQQQQGQQEKEKFSKKEQSSGESAFDDILSNIYSGQKQSNTSTRRRHKK